MKCGSIIFYYAGVEGEEQNLTPGIAFCIGAGLAEYFAEKTGKAADQLQVAVRHPLSVEFIILILLCDVLHTLWCLIEFQFDHAPEFCTPGEDTATYRQHYFFIPKAF